MASETRQQEFGHIVLSPTKPTRSGDEPTSRPPIQVGPTPAQIFAWTMKKEAIAHCFIKDVNTMKESSDQGVSYYHIGRVPCRTVNLVGTLVGLTVYEGRTIYLLDDGTGVLDCFVRHPKKQILPGDVRSSSTDHQTDIKPMIPQIEPPAPLYPIGSTIRVVGRVHFKRYAKEVICDAVERCRSSSEELDHWRKVIKLHKESYSLSDPFVPPSPCVAAATAFSVPTPPKKPQPNTSHAIMISPPASEFYPTPSTSTATSPAKSVYNASSPPRLKHPTRLRSHALTANTFRIYVKHYMDNCSEHPKPSHKDGTESDADTVSFSLHRMPLTPTKRARNGLEESTPRPFKLRRTPDSPNATPGPSKRPTTTFPRQHSEDPTERRLGFTLSYLRRVPELSTLARRVVEAEARRREREKKAQATSSDRSKETSRVRSPRSREAVGPKMKRLFIWAILKLYEEGSIILWEGPVHPLPASINDLMEASALWRMTASDVTSSTVSSVSSSRSRYSQDDEDDGVLSDPLLDEESYVPLSTAQLAIQVEAAIRALTAPPVSSTDAGGSILPAPAVSRRRKFRTMGPTKEEITTYLRRSDGRWDRVGAWAVQEALEWLQKEDRAWRVSEDEGGKWELCS